MLKPTDRSVSAALSIEGSNATRLGQIISPKLAAHPDESGFITLGDPHDAFAARVFLAQKAERTLDVQYYIWRQDLTGTLLFEALHAAADRGVRVRLLIDDNNTPGMDPLLAALDSHPNIEVRLFNPFAIRKPRWIGYLTDFSRLNRRMHNKSFTADNQVTIVGGRNVGDEYFGAADGELFADIDLLTVGPVVRDVSTDFDRYWACDSSYPVAALFGPIAPAQLDALATRAKAIERDPAAREYVEAMRESDLSRSMDSGNLDLEWAQAQLVSDHPRKGLGMAESDQLLTHEIAQIVGRPTRALDLISPYFVPTASGARALVRLARSGVNLQILTNSLDATDVAAVHSGYAKWRPMLLKAGVRLYEMKRSAPKSRKHWKDRKIRKLRRNWKSGPFGASGTSLHAKTFAVDGERVFVGSFNFDPRSAKLNTEMGLIIASPALASRISDTFRTRIPDESYELGLSDKGKLRWIERLPDGARTEYQVEPKAGIFRRITVRLMALLPIESLL